MCVKVHVHKHRGGSPAWKRRAHSVGLARIDGASHAGSGTHVITQSLGDVSRGWYFGSNRPPVYCGSPATCVALDSCARCCEEDRQVNNWTERGRGWLPQGRGQFNVRAGLHQALGERGETNTALPLPLSGRQIHRVPYKNAVVKILREQWCVTSLTEQGPHENNRTAFNLPTLNMSFFHKVQLGQAQNPCFLTPLQCFVQWQGKAHMPTLNMPFFHKVQLVQTPDP